MFDIGFLEILIVLIIALLVIGPERMPEVARKLGAFVGKTKRFIDSVKNEGELQDTVNELKKSMDMQEQQRQISDLESELQNSLTQTHSGQELDMEQFKRPTFGGSEQPVESTSGSQFSKAPAQPVMPSPQNVPASAPEEKPTAVEPTPAVAEAPKEQPAATSKPADSTDNKSST